MADTFDYEYAPPSQPPEGAKKTAPSLFEYEYAPATAPAKTPVTGYEVEKPVTYPPMGSPKEKYKEIPWSEVTARAEKTFVPSLWEEAKKTIEPFYPSNLPETGMSLGQIGYGLASKAEGAVAPYLGYKQDPAKKAQDEALVDAMKKYYGERYGSEESIKKAVAEEPGSVLDRKSTRLNSSH